MYLELSESLYSINYVTHWCFNKLGLCSAFIFISFILQLFPYVLGVFLWSIPFQFLPTFSTFVNAGHCIIK